MAQQNEYDIAVKSKDAQMAILDKLVNNQKEITRSIRREAMTAEKLLEEAYIPFRNATFNTPNEELKDKKVEVPYENFIKVWNFLQNLQANAGDRGLLEIDKTLDTAIYDSSVREEILKSLR